MPCHARRCASFQSPVAFSVLSPDADDHHLDVRLAERGTVVLWQAMLGARGRGLSHHDHVTPQSRLFRWL
jgi:hypothetical protein